MVFSSVFFIFYFLPLVLLGHTVLLSSAGLFKRSKWALCSRQLANFFLLLLSLVFYSWGEPRLVWVMIVSCLANYILGFCFSSTFFQNGLCRKMLFLVALAVNLGFLCYFKYFNFFVDNGGNVLLNMVLPASWALDTIPRVALPLGISFYTFQGLSYIFDVWRGDVEPTKNPVTFACYLTMFPQLIAGPIVRYAEIREELHGRSLGWEKAARGVSRFIFGLAKKVLVANTVGKVADAAFSVPGGELTAAAAWIGIVCYSLQIYYDFSGYSDMAIGMGYMMGFTFPENFSFPYSASCIRDFWRRWHITLSVWFRDYLYIPMGGNRGGVLKTSFNLLAVFFLCGLWHGASWMFVVWGLFHGFFLVLERIYPEFTKLMPRFIAHLYTILVFGSGWVLFRAPSFSVACSYFKSLGGGFPFESLEEKMVWFFFHGIDVQIAIVFGVLFSMPLLPRLKTVFEKGSPLMRMLYEISRPIVLLGLLIVCFMFLVGNDFNPFIYFRF